MEHIKTLYTGNPTANDTETGCGECQTSCQSACKTSCTVASQICERERA